MPTDEMFQQVRLESRISNACTPQPPGPGWVGILIDAPRRVILARDHATEDHFLTPRVPICGSYMIPASWELPSHPLDSMRLVTLEQGADRLLSGGFHRTLGDPNPPTSAPAAELAAMNVGGVFSTDLMAHLAVNARPEVLLVRVELGRPGEEPHLSSNEVCITLVME